MHLRHLPDDQQPPRWRDRTDAGRALAQRLHDGGLRDGDLLRGAAGAAGGGSPVVVVGLGPAGVEVAAPVAAALGAALDVLLVAPLPLPGRRRPPLVAVTGAGMRLQVERPVPVSDARAARQFDESWVHRIRALAAVEDAVREGLPRLELRGAVVVVVADDLGAHPEELVAAVSALRRRRPARIVLAAPVGPVLARGLRWGGERSGDAVVLLRTGGRWRGASAAAATRGLRAPAPSPQDAAGVLARAARGRLTAAVWAGPPPGSSPDRPRAARRPPARPRRVWDGDG